jgi:aminoglycoside 6'-N-acetyltransferase I
MRERLWPSEPGEHACDINRYFTGTVGEPVEVLLAFNGRGEAIGFIELSIRAYAQGCTGDRVAFIEGWYVESEERRRGVGAALVSAAESWAKSHSCSELASDTEIGNHASVAAHLALGFTDVGRIRCFKKSLGQRLEYSYPDGLKRFEFTAPGSASSSRRTPARFCIARAQYFRVLRLTRSRWRNSPSSLLLKVPDL